MNNHKILFLSIFKKRESCKIKCETIRTSYGHDFKQSMKEIGEQLDDLEFPRKRIPSKMCLTHWTSPFITVLKSNASLDCVLTVEMQVLQ